jgi:hypothetical protein
LADNSDTAARALDRMVLRASGQAGRRKLIERFDIQYEQYGKWCPGSFQVGNIRTRCSVGRVATPNEGKIAMSSSLKFLGLAVTIVAGLALTSPIFAADDNPSPGSSMGSGMMEQGGMMDMMKQMSQMMESCNKMMQSTPDSGKPNEQRRKDMPMQPEKKG